MIAKLIRLLTPIVVLFAGIGIVVILFKTKPTPVKSTAFSVAPMVTVQSAERNTIPVEVMAKGTVIAARTVQVAPQVSGKVTERNRDLEVGGLLSAGDSLLTIEDEDYKLAIQVQEARVAKARMALEVERSRKRVAEKEWELLSGDLELSDEGRNLALRNPQLQSAKAELKAAKAALGQARLALDRTVIPAPFDSLVMKTNGEKGQQVSPAMPIATLVDTSRFWVKASVSQEELVTLREKDSAIQATITLPTGQSRPGVFLRELGEIEPRGRTVQILVEVQDPLLRNPSTVKGAPLFLGSYVSLSLLAGQLQDVVEIPRAARTDAGTVWTVTPEKTLQEISVNVLYESKNSLFLQATMDTATRIVTSPLAGPVPGMKVQLQSEQLDTQPETAKTSAGGASQ